jgi:predicted nucleic acid-binding protein
MWTGSCTGDNSCSGWFSTPTSSFRRFFGGFPDEAYRAALERRCTLIASPGILAELARTLRAKFGMPEPDIVAYVKPIGRIAEIVRPSQSVAVVRNDADNCVRECAEAGRVDLIVSGDRDLLGLNRHGAIPIVRPADFVRTLGPSEFKE